MQQNGSVITAGRDFSAAAGRDFAAIASQIDALRDIDITATGDVALMSAADEEHSTYSSKKLKTQEDHVSQVATVLKAGADLAISASQDLALSASRVTAGDEAYLVAGGKLALLSAEDSDYSLYDMKKKGSFGSKKTQRDEVTQITNVGSEISTGGDLTLVSGSDQLYQAAELNSGGDLTIDSGGDITFEAVKDLHQESHEKSKSDLGWFSMKGKGSTDETVRQSEIVVQGELVINAVGNIHADVLQINQQTVHESIDAMVKADPKLAWLKELEAQGGVDWRQVQEIHTSFKYSNSGLGPAAQIIIAIIMAAVAGPMFSGMIGTGATAGTAMAAAVPGVAATATSVGVAATSAGWANLALTAVATSAATTATVSTVNNRGNLGAVFKDVTSTDAMRGYVVSGVTAGLTAGVYDKWTGTQTEVGGALPNAGKVVAEGGLNTLDGVARFGANQLLQNGTSTLLDRALGGDSQFDDALRTSLANTFAAVGFSAIGDAYVGKPKTEINRITKISLHAIMGGLAAEAAGGDFKAGALAAGLNEAMVDKLAGQFGDMPKADKDRLLVMSSQLVGVLAAAASGGDAKSLETGAWAAANSTKYNYLSHQDVLELEQIAKTCDAEGTCDKLAAEAKARSQANHERLLKCAEVGNCAAIRAEIDSGSNAINALDAKLSDGAASKIIRGYTFIGGDNLNDWTLAGQLHLSYIAKLYNSNDPAWLREGSLYLDQTGFSPFGINPAALAGVRAVVGEGLTGSSTNTKSRSIDGIDGVAKSPTTGGGTLKPEISPDAEAGMHYNDPVAGGGITKATGANATTNTVSAPRFITDSVGNTIDLDYTKGLKQTNVTVTGARGGIQYPLQGQTPDSYASLGNGHVVVYGPEGRALYDVSSSRIKVVEWNQAPNGTYFPKKGNDTKIFEGNVPVSVLESLGLK